MQSPTLIDCGGDRRTDQAPSPRISPTWQDVNWPGSARSRALPEVSEHISHGAPCFFVRQTRALCYSHDHHRGDTRASLWCPAPPGVQDELFNAEPERFFTPMPSAGGTFSTWLGVYLDSGGNNKVDWAEIAAVVEDAYRIVAPKRLVAELDTR